MKRALAFALSAVTAFALASCSSTGNDRGDDRVQSRTYTEGVPGGTVVETYTVTATVTAIDTPARNLTLMDRDGKKTPVTCGPSVINFDRIEVGDVVKAIVTEELAVAMANAENAGSMGESSTVTLQPKGSNPRAVVVQTQHYSATIKDIHLKRRKVTLHFPDGSDRTFVVRKDIDLNQRKVGEEVAFRVAVRMAISVEKP